MGKPEITEYFSHNFFFFNFTIINILTTLLLYWKMDNWMIFMYVRLSLKQDFITAQDIKTCLCQSRT